MDQDELARGSDGGVTIADRESARGIAEPHVAGPRYRFGAVLGRGGMGEVLEAHDDQVGREVAIKRMRADEPNPKQIARFMREARIQGRLEHPAIVPVHELGHDEHGKPYFAMKKLSGITLAQILHGEVDERASATTVGIYPRQRLLRAIADVCLAVELAHKRGFVHRDLKPDNIMLGEYGETYVLDWGVAKVTGEDDGELASVHAGEFATAAGAAVGTPGYMAPEQARGLGDVDGRADVYSLGCVLFEVLTGERLHPSGQAGMKSAVAGIDSRPSRRTPDRDIPPELDELVVAATARDRLDRIQSARQLGQRIQQFLDGDRDHALRTQFARKHLANAQTAFAAEDRATAMREAGRALVLDPSSAVAGQLITKMMIEPPAVLPPEVIKAFNTESSDVVRRTVFAGVIASSFYIVFVPLLAIFGHAQTEYVVAMGVLAVASMVLLSWMRSPGRQYLMAPVLALHLLILAITARMFTPFLLGPGLGAVTAIGFMTGPQYAKRQASLVAALCILAVLGPFFAERVGWLSSTIEILDGAAVIRAPMTAGSTVGLWLLALYTVTIITASVILARALRVAERGARQRMHVQAWQLRQLVSQPT